MFLEFKGLNSGFYQDANAKSFYTGGMELLLQCFVFLNTF